MGKSSTIDGFFKRKNPTNLDADRPSPTSNVETPITEDPGFIFIAKFSL